MGRSNLERLAIKKEESDKSIFSGGRQLHEFLKRNADRIESRKYSNKDVEYILTKDILEVDRYFKALDKAMEDLSERINSTLKIADREKRKILPLGLYQSRIEGFNDQENYLEIPELESY